jgi:hypothetical protein
MATIKGKLKIKGETKEFGNNGFTKREIVIETVETYPQSILIEFIKDNIYKTLPRRLKKIGREFLQALQSLHDEDDTWEKGRTGESLVWSDQGLKCINDIITEFKVNIPLLEVKNN